MLCHRIVWSFVVIVIVLLVLRDLRWVGLTPAEPAPVGRLLSVAAVCISTNWLIYIWAVNNDRVVEAALGYFITPLVTVMLGVLVLGAQSGRCSGSRSRAVPSRSWSSRSGTAGCPDRRPSLAASFSSYGFIKKKVTITPSTR